MNSTIRTGQRLALLLAASCVTASAGESPFVCEVQSGHWERFREAVSLQLGPQQAAGLRGRRLVEIGQDGNVLSPVLHSLDGTDPGKVVFTWLPPGITPAGTRRRFALVEGEAQAEGASDLEVKETDTHIVISNSYFRVFHPREGHGGFPDKVVFRLSGNEETRMSVLARLFSRELRRVYSAEADPRASARLVFSHPTRVVVETRTGYRSGGDYAPGDPQAAYRYVYSPCSPVVQVSCVVTREDDRFWNELHFLQPSRSDLHYTRFVVGDPGKEHPMATPGTKSRSRSSRHWGVMATDQDAIGVGPRGAICWDASDEFVYYVDMGCTQWKTRTASFEGLLYLGPASEDFSWYSRWLGPSREQTVRIVQADVAAAEQAEEGALEGAHELVNDALRIVFADGAKGFDCLGIENRLAGARFVRARESAPGLWKIEFRGPHVAPPDGRPKRPEESIVLDNRADAERRAKLDGQTLTLSWWNLGLPDEPDAVDVSAEIKLLPGKGESEWRIRVANRSTRVGAWTTHYPILSTVCPKGTADVMLPTGNWGGVLRKGHRGAFTGRYPSGQCPVQFLAFNLGRAGLYVGAHDDGARSKQPTCTTDQDATFVTYAEDMGVPGSHGAVEFPVVVQAYTGDWWQAARIYRKWAVHTPWARKGWLRDRTDVPKHLLDLGVWMLGGGTPASVRPWMLKAEELFPVSVGLHWYNWHQIPFDHTYPEYFPTKPDFDKVVRELVGRGQVMMPYINGRLWDRDIPSFEVGVKGACKQRNGEVYTEIYGSKRRLSPMCPYTELWQDKVNEIIHGLIHDCGVNAVYLDQIGAARPRRCFDPSHGHPLGGGRHWVDGYRVMLDRVKAQGVANNCAFTTENTAEPYLDNIEGFLAWSPRYDWDLPVLPAVYSGYTIYFTSPQDPRDDLDAFVMAQGRDFLWGCQLGWNGTWILDDHHRDKANFMGRLCQYRLAAKEFFVYGQLLDEVRPLRSVPELTRVWYRRTRHTATLPAVMSTLWRAEDGTLAVFAVNYDRGPRRFAYRVDPGQWGRTSSDGWLVSMLAPEASTPWGLHRAGTIERNDMIPGHGVLALTIRPATALRDTLSKANSVAEAEPQDSRAGAAARQFLFEQTLRELALDVRVQNDMLTVATGEPAEVIVNVANRSDQAQRVDLTWADGRRSSLPVDGGQSVEARHVFWPAETDESFADGSVTVAVGKRTVGEQRRLPVYIRSVPPVSVTMGDLSKVRAGESFMLPIEVRNSSRVTRRGQMELTTPSGWRVEPGAQIDVGALKPGQRHALLLKCTVPPSSKTTQGRVAVRFVEHAASTPITVLKSRPVAACRLFTKPPKIDGALSDWTQIEETIELGGTNADSVKIKDYAGPNDCSAKVKVGWDARHFYIAAEVADNALHQDEDGFQCWSGDCIQLAFRTGSPNKPSGFDGTEHEVGLTQAPGGPLLFQWMPGKCPLTEGRLAVVRDANATRYEAAVPWPALGIKSPALFGRVTWSLTVNDNDGEGFRGWLEWTPGVCGAKDSSQFGWLKFAR